MLSGVKSLPFGGPERIQTHEIIHLHRLQRAGEAGNRGVADDHPGARCHVRERLAQPDQNGQELAWSLGTLNRFDRVSVSLANPTTTLQLDSGARAFGTLDAMAVSDDILPRMRREGGVVSGR